METFFKNNYVFRWSGEKLDEIVFYHKILPEELIGIDKQKRMVSKNIESFLAGDMFLNMLFWGEKGCGKSSLVAMLITVYKEKGLRVIEFPQEKIETIYTLYKIIRPHQDYKFIIFFDDISFDEQDIFYRRFKSVMEGGLESTPENVMFIATSNRRHLIEDKVYDTFETPYDRDEVNEALSLYARFGLIVGFYPLSKNDYLKICEFYLHKFKIEHSKNWEQEAENFAINRGGRTGRVAKQFAIFKRIFKEAE